MYPIRSNLKNPMEFSRVRFRLKNLKLGYSDNVFHMFHVPFANRVVYSHFLRDRKLEKKCCESACS